LSELARDTLVLETPIAGFNEVSAFPLLFGGVFSTLGLVCLLSAPGRGWMALTLGIPALLVGVGVGRVGLQAARTRHRIELGRNRARVSTLGAGKPRVAECSLLDLRVSLESGSSWQMGIMPQVHQWGRHWTVLNLTCGAQRFRLLTGRSDREKEQLVEAVHAWIESGRNLG
jgi:hypothetical protein